MGAKREESRSQPLLEFSFADLEKRKRLVGEIRVQSRYFEVPDDGEMPEYGTDNVLGIAFNNENKDFYTDVARYLHEFAHLEPFGLVVINGSRTTAQKVVVRIRFVDPELDVLSPDERGPEPSRHRFGMLMQRDTLISGVSVIHDEDGDEVEIDLGDIQPGTPAWSRRPFYLGSRTSKQFQAEISMSGHNLAEPIRLNQQFDFEVEPQRASVEEVVALAEKVW